MVSPDVLLPVASSNPAGARHMAESHLFLGMIAYRYRCETLCVCVVGYQKTRLTPWGTASSLALVLKEDICPCLSNRNACSIRWSRLCLS